MSVAILLADLPGADDLEDFSRRFFKAIGVTGAGPKHRDTDGQEYFEASGNDEGYAVTWAESSCYPDMPFQIEVTLKEQTSVMLISRVRGLRKKMRPDGFRVARTLYFDEVGDKAEVPSWSASKGKIHRA